MAKYTKTVETWNVVNPKTGKRIKVGKIAVRDEFGRFHGSTNFRSTSAVGQVAKGRR